MGPPRHRANIHHHVSSTEKQVIPNSQHRKCSFIYLHNIAPQLGSYRKVVPYRLECPGTRPQETMGYHKCIATPPLP